ncbi:hypothetical protein, partial [Vibrio parahaemolyticus]|uniref:hypothetical protein n=1 Tax=Vibrio parahaemolyticus TaxID=670 RepID=UPI002852C1A4
CYAVVFVLKWHAVTLVLRASPLNWALGSVRNFLVQISNFSLAICSSISAIWPYLPKFMNHSTRKTCQSLWVASLGFVTNLSLVPFAQIASILFVFEMRLLAEISH